MGPTAAARGPTGCSEASRAGTWTDHLKTELAAGVPGQTESYSYSSRQLPNRVSVFTQDERTFTATRFSLAQAYQFGRNAMFHPYALAGLDVDRERIDLERHVVIGSTVAPTEVSSAYIVRARPFAGAGFKAYVSERAFFKGDIKIDLGARVDELAWTAGFGVDFTRARRAPRANASSTPAALVPRGREPVEMWRAYATQLAIGSLVDVAEAGREHLVGQLVDVDAAGVLVKPCTRVRVPTRRVAFDRLEMLRLHVEPTQAERAGAVAGAAGAAAGIFFGALMLLFLAFAN